MRPWVQFHVDSKKGVDERAYADYYADRKLRRKYTPRGQSAAKRTPYAARSNRSATNSAAWPSVNRRWFRK